MHGKITVDKNEYHFFFDEKTFELTIHDFPAIILSTEGILTEDRINYKDVLFAQSFDTKLTNIQFVIKRIVSSHMDRIVLKVLYYLETRIEVFEFDSITFAGEELNSFYDIKTSYETINFDNDGCLDIRVKKFDEVNKEYQFENDDDLKNITLNFYRRLNFGKTEILTLFTELQLRFNKSQDVHQIYDHYYLIYNFMRFITYRNNIRFDAIGLKVQRDDNKFENVGNLRVFVDEDNFYIENDKTKRDRQIKAIYLEDKILKVIDLIRSKRLYTDHYPESSADMRHITPARFLLVTAAFEWECEEVYGNYKYKENADFKSVTDFIYDFLEAEKQNFEGKKKKYLKNYQKSFVYTGVSLSEKLQYAFKDNNEVLSIFIENLYKINHIDKKEYSYNKISERIGQQRNNYAHGQIDREMDDLVILDFIVLEWLLYAMRLKQIGFEITVRKKIINDLFGRNFHIKENQ